MPSMKKTMNRIEKSCNKYLYHHTLVNGMNKLIFLVMVATISATAQVSIGAGVGMPVYGDNPFDSGFAHGREDCQDIKSGVDQEDVYYFKDQYGPDMHTDRFNEGFRAGWYDAGCAIQELNDRLYPEVYSDNNSNNNNDVNAYRESFNDNQVLSQPQNQQANTNQYAGCPQLIVNGDCYQKQNQDVNNEFAQANRGELND